MKRIEVTQQDEGMRLDVYLSCATDLSRSAAQRLTDAGEVSVNGAAANKKYKVRVGDTVEYGEPEPEKLDAEPETIPLDIVYEDNDLIVVNKPRGMVVHPAAGNRSGTLVNALLAHCGDSLSGINGIIRPGIVHRIDKNTSGLIVCAKNDRAHISLASQIKEHKADRIYRAVLVGNFREDEGTVDAPIARHPTDRKKMAVIAGGREAVTHYRVLERYRGFSYAELVLETGRTHQIRVHMAYRGHPVIGDAVYGAGKTEFERRYDYLLGGQCLHAATLGFCHPVTGEYMKFNSPLPEYFEIILDKLRKTAQ